MPFLTKEEEKKRKLRQEILELKNKGYTNEAINFAYYSMGKDVSSELEGLEQFQGGGVEPTVEVGGHSYKVAGNVTPAQAAQIETQKKENETAQKSAIRGLELKLNQIESLIGNEEGTKVGDEKGLKSAVGTGVGGRGVNLPYDIYTNPDRSRFSSGAAQVVATESIQSLIDSKAEGATFGQLSEKELALLMESATKLGNLSMTDDDGNLIGFNASEDVVRKELENLRTLTKDALDLAKFTGDEEEKQTQNQEAMVKINGVGMTISQAKQWADQNQDNEKAQAFLSDYNSGLLRETPSPTGETPSPTGMEQGRVEQGEKETFMDKVGEFFGGVAESYQERAGKGKASAERYLAGEQSMTETLFQDVAQAPAFIGDVIFSGIKAVASEELEQETKQAVEELAPIISPVVEKYQKWAEENPRAAANVEATLDIASIVPGVKVGKVIIKGAEKAPKVVKEVLEETVNIAKKVKNKAGKIKKDGVAKNLEALDGITQGNKPLRTYVEAQRKKGINVKEELAETNIMEGTVDKNGKITTLGKDGAYEKYYAKEIAGNEDVVSKRLREGGEIVSLETLKKDMKEAINKSTIAGSSKQKALRAIEREIEGLGLDATDGQVLLEKVHNAKITLSKTANYLDPEKQVIQKEISRVLKETVEKNVKDMSVKEINRELQKKYAVLEYIERLDGRIVEGGRLGKYFSGVTGAVTGAVVGSTLGGPFGAAAGATAGPSVAKGLRGKMMQSTFKKVDKEILGN